MSYNFLTDHRFAEIEPLVQSVYLATPTPHEEEEMKYIKACYRSGWLTTAGENIDRLEDAISSYMDANGKKKALAVVNGTAAIHLAVKLAAERAYHSSSGRMAPDGKGAGGALAGKRVFVSDLTFGASANPIVYEGGEPVFIDSEYETWNMDPDALRKAFTYYPDTKIVLFTHLYGVPGKIEEVKEICGAHGALLIEDAAESLGAAVKGCPTGALADYGVVSFNGNKIITGSSGGALIVPDAYAYRKAKKWSTQSREDAPWYEHEELGYNYRISNMVAGVIRGQWHYLAKHREQKKDVYMRYRKGLEGLPVTVHGGGNYWMSCALIDTGAMAHTVRSARKASFHMEKGKSSPTEILEALEAFHAEGRPVWKPMHLQPLYAGNVFVTKSGGGPEGACVHTGYGCAGVSGDLFQRGVCLPSDNKMTREQQGLVMEVIRRCFT